MVTVSNKVNLHHPIAPLPVKKTPDNKTNIKQTGQFKELLNAQIAESKENKISFSNHCLRRLEQNNIKLSDVQVNKLTKAMDNAKEKGAKESLMLMDDLALVVSIKNRTVITAVDTQRMKDNIFTNIDSAVIV